MSAIDHGRRRIALAAAGLAGAAAIGPVRAQPAAGDNILRLLFENPETGFDPAQAGDLYSNRVTSHIFESLLDYDPLALPVRLVPLTAEAMPEVADDYKTWTVRLRRGILFTDDPAFRGKPRELVAADVVYSFKRVLDPVTKSPFVSTLNEDGIVGLWELRQRALRDKKPLDYATEVEGLRALDRYTVQFKLAASRPRFASTLASSDFASVAREVVEAWGADFASHPVGTGPYRLKAWRRSSRIVLEKNLLYRERFYESQPAADDALALAAAKKLNGKRLPLNDGVEISVVVESQPRWLTFLGGQADFARVPPDISALSVPNGKLAPNLAKEGVTLQRYVNCDIAMSYFNMEDPVVGGYTPEKVALRRAIHLAYDIEREVTIIRRGNAIPAQAAMAPHTFGYDPAFRTDNSSHDLSRARALLDMFGYLDRDGDGWRELPDGSPLVLTMSTETSQVDRQYNENWSKSLGRLGVQLRFEMAEWPEHYKAARAGKLQMWFLGDTATQPDAQRGLEMFYSESIGEANLARFKNAAFDAIYRRMLGLPDGPEREALFKRASEIVVAYLPYRIHCHRIYNDMAQPWVTGYRQPFFRNQSWHYVAIDGARRARALG